MISLRTLKPYHLYSLLKHQNTSLSVQIPPHTFPSIHECVSRVSSFSPYCHFQRNLSISTQLVTEERIEETSESTELEKKQENGKKKKKKPLDVMFKEAVGLIETQEESETSDEEESEEGGGGNNGDLSWKQIHQVKKKLRNLEREVRRLKGVVKVSEQKKKKKDIQKTKQISITEEEEELPIKESKPKTLSSIFLKSDELPKLHSTPVKEMGTQKKPDTLKEKGTQKKPDTLKIIHSAPVKEEGTQKKPDTSKIKRVRATLKPFKEFSPDVQMLVKRLYEDGYLKDANFMPPNKLDMSYFTTFYSRDFLRSAAEKFGRDHQEIIKRLSHDDLKRVVLFGCPIAEKKTVWVTKSLRYFFDIQEDIVCRPCQLRSSCKDVNKRAWKKPDELSLADVMRVLTLYALELVPEQLELPSEIKDSVSKLLNDVVNPSQ